MAIKVSGNTVLSGLSTGDYIDGKKAGRPPGVKNKTVKLYPEQIKTLFEIILKQKPSPEMEELKLKMEELSREIKKAMATLPGEKSLYEIQAENIKRVNEAIRAGR